MKAWEWVKGCRPVTRRRHEAELAALKGRALAQLRQKEKLLEEQAKNLAFVQDQATFLELALISLARGRGGRIWLKRSTMERTPEGLSLKVTHEGGDLVFEVLPPRKVVPIAEGRIDAQGAEDRGGA